jgi:hypothetical protein
MNAMYFQDLTLFYTTKPFHDINQLLALSRGKRALLGNVLQEIGVVRINTLPGDQ